MTIKIVTDSTCDLPENVIQELGITVVPLFINLFDKGYLDGVEITRQDFYTNLPDYKVHPTTGIPGLNAFTQAYEALSSNGASEILSIHISESLSGTVGVAQTAAREFDQIPVTVRDSGQLSLGTGFQVETAARMANEGKSMAEIQAVLDDMMSENLCDCGFENARLSAPQRPHESFCGRAGQPITAKTNPDDEEWTAWIRASAHIIQSGSPDH